MEFVCVAPQLIVKDHQEGAVVSFVYVLDVIEDVLQLFKASQEIALRFVVEEKDWLDQIDEEAVGFDPLVVYLTTVHQAQAVQVTASELEK